jgi:uncharacterized membrane protein YbhN (UPF0104 family)
VKHVFEKQRGQNHRHQIGGVLRSAISLGLLVIAGWYAYAHGDELAVLLTIPWHFLAVLGVVLILTGIASAAEFAVLYRTLGPSMSVFESYGLSQLTSAMNQLIPGRPGGVARIVYMKHRYGTPYSQTPAILLGSIVLSLFVGSILMALTNAIMLLSGHLVPSVFWIGSAGSALSVAVFWMSIPAKWTSRLGRVGKMLILFSEGWRSLRTDKGRLVRAGIYQLLAYAFWGLSISVAYRSLGVAIDPVVGVSIAVFLTFSNAVIITPGNLGIQEAVAGYLTMLSGSSFVEGVAASALIRATGLVITLVLAPVAWYLLFVRRGIQIAR